MSDFIRHECGLAILRLLKPPAYYQSKYGSPFYGLNKMFLLMQKQHNRGQDGAGLANVKLNMPPGYRYIHRIRSVAPNAIQDIFDQIATQVKSVAGQNGTATSEQESSSPEPLPFTGEIFLGHLRYGTFGGNTIAQCHPFLRDNNWPSRTLLLAGNFNLTNVEELFRELVELGQHPREKADTVTVLEKIGHFLDEEVEALYEKIKAEGFAKKFANERLARDLDVAKILRRACKRFDGGFAIGGIIGHGDVFLLRDSNGIRPAYYYVNEEVFVAASERPAIQTAFDVPLSDIQEVPPGHVVVVKKDGRILVEEVLPPAPRTSCSFERIYFSRGSDADIYVERKKLGQNLMNSILQAIDHDLENTVFSYIPNTAETAFLGLLQALEDYLAEQKLKDLCNPDLLKDVDACRKILRRRIRVEKIVIKDVKLRTFITPDDHRDEMVRHVYDITYGSIRPGQDRLVVLDDSIVRGTTLRRSIVRMLDRLQPSEIIVVSSAPQIRYPDCYGIDMAKVQDFVAFRAAIELLHERGLWHVIHDTHVQALELKKQNQLTRENLLKKIYEPFTTEEISCKIAELIRERSVKAPVKVIYQTIEGLHDACPNHRGDWYFTGNYPTPGGNAVANKAFLNFMAGQNVRAYAF
ncbi:MAG: amidophosphoribosyltransferase [Flavobacteriales bacterium]|nr:amidophosphoribosyltransferase [Flavobacteriales bacterium]MCX7768181.1 amidophosphoribosyltransferase [Flavobacteriales bacterium]MDW8409132.1 amidophosphoribosyltransferase [Flavobacteriales bacterium]